MKLWPTPTPANGVIHHPKESEQFFPKKKRKKERKKTSSASAAAEPRTGEVPSWRARFWYRVERHTPTGRPPPVGGASSRAPAPTAGSTRRPREPTTSASGDVTGKRPYNLRGRRWAPRAGDAAPTHAHGPRPRRQPPNPNAGDRRLRRSSSRPRHACGAPGL